VKDPGTRETTGGLEDFYQSWSEKTPAQIEHDISSGDHKAELITSRIPGHLLEPLKRVVDFGCGYGGFLGTLATRLTVNEAWGVDYSPAAIQVAKKRFGGGVVSFHRLPTLDARAIPDFMRSVAPEGADCVCLIDLLEHVPDCRALLAALSQTSTTFLIKLPLERSVLDNYVLTKEYPGPGHSNGHLREFDVDDVHAFIRRLGLTPLYEDTYVYRLAEMFPPPPERLPLVRATKRGILIALRATTKVLLPRRWFLRVIGGGGYFCLATYDSANILEP